MRRFAFWGSATLSTSTHRHYDESVHRIKQLAVEIIRFHTIETLVTFETRQPRVYRAPFISEDSNFDLSTALFHVTMYRQFARKVGTSANSALIRYYLPRLKLSSLTRVSEGTNA